MTPNLKIIAARAVQLFRKGDLWFGDQPFEVTFPKAYLFEKLEEWVENHCNDGISLQAALEFAHIHWSPCRIAEIESRNSKPTLSELIQWCNSNPDFCEPVGILPWPLEQDGVVLGWALIQNSGFVLDPDINLIDVFTDKPALLEFVSENFVT